MRRSARFLPALAAGLLVTGCAPEAAPDAGAGPAVQEEAVSEAEMAEETGVLGTWIRQATYAGGELVGETPATLVIEPDAFSSAAAACDNSGSLALGVDRMEMSVEQSTCPSIITVGSTVGYDYVVEGDQLTIINNDFGAEVREVYVRAD